MFDMGTSDSGDKKPESKPTGPIMLLNEKLQHEKELLGFYVSGHPMNPFKQLAGAVDTFTGEEWRLMENREAFRVCGVITSVTRKISRRDNRPWCMMTVATTKDTYSLHAFANSYAEFGPAIEDGKRVIVEGQVMRRPDDDVQLAINSVKPLENSLSELIKAVTFIIDNNGESSDFVRLLRQELEQQMGKTVVRVGVLLDENQYVLADLASSLEWTINKDQFNKLSKHPAVRDIKLEAPQPVAPAPSWGR